MKLLAFVLVFMFLLQVRAGMEPAKAVYYSVSTGSAHSQFDRCVALAYKYDTNPQRCID